MELIASLSSALLSLSIQQVSIHAYPRSSRRACWHVSLIFRKEALVSILDRLPKSAKTTSSELQVWERMAYGGVSPGNQVSCNVFVSIRYMLPGCASSPPPDAHILFLDGGGRIYRLEGIDKPYGLEAVISEYV